MIIQIEPFIDNEELEQLKRVVSSKFVTEHELTKEFENFFKEYTGAKHVIAYTNGTLALFAILQSLGIGAGDEVIVPDLTFIATSNAVIMSGAKPVFCDMKNYDFRLNLDILEGLISEKTKAILPVHLYGLAENMDAITEIAKKYNLFVIEDAAQGVGVRLNNKHVGTFGNAGILSFYGNKTITAGEGGLILTNDDEIAAKCYRLKNHGRDKKGIFKHEYIGYNFSFTEMQAAIGLAQVSKLNKIIEKKLKIYNKYYEGLKEVKSIKFSSYDKNISPVYWFTNIFIDDKDELVEFLLNNGIQTRQFFYPLHLQPCYKDLNQGTGNFKISDLLYQTGLSLPSSYGLTDQEIDYIIETIKKYYGEKI